MKRGAPQVRQERRDSFWLMTKLTLLAVVGGFVLSWLFLFLLTFLRN